MHRYADHCQQLFQQMFGVSAYWLAIFLTNSPQGCFSVGNGTVYHIERKANQGSANRQKVDIINNSISKKFFPVNWLSDIHSPLKINRCNSVVVQSLSVTQITLDLGHDIKLIKQITMNELYSSQHSGSHEPCRQRSYASPICKKKLFDTYFENIFTRVPTYHFIQSGLHAKKNGSRYRTAHIWQKAFLEKISYERKIVD